MLANMIRMVEKGEKLNILYKECLKTIKKQARQIEELLQEYKNI